jgi:hypothetical protein
VTAITVASVRGAPGVSTTWLLLAVAAAAAGREVVAAEADPSGNDVGVTLQGVGENPGLTSLAATGRRGLPDAAVVADHARPIGDGALLLPAPVSGEETTASLAAVAGPLADLAARDSRLWLFDVGRLWVGSPALPLVQRSALTLLVCRPGPTDALALPARVAALRRAGCEDVALACVGKGPYTAAEVAAFAGVTLVGELPVERDATAVVRGALAGRSRRSLLWRGAVELAAALGWILAQRSGEPTVLADRAQAEERR